MFCIVMWQDMMKFMTYLDFSKALCDISTIRLTQLLIENQDNYLWNIFQGLPDIL